ncbi:hypothetical protein M8J76_010154 [Diaphorina citri]|nr:hypothetical protein M8J75_011669 [Diaphorina citri]KAI5749779.1 hypothetical protein M8J76_010154 [Diaphorina citri]
MAAGDSSLMENFAKSYVWFVNQIRRDDLKWRNIALIIVSHTIAIVGFLKYWNKAKLSTYLFTVVVGGLGGFGVTAGAHRLWTHKTYKAKWPLRVLLLTGYAIAGQNSLYDWVRDHRVHHKFSDTDADPHNAQRGFFFSHIGWLMQKKSKAVIEKGRQLDLSDLFEDPLVVVFQKYYIYIRFVMCFFLPAYINTVWLGEDWWISFITMDFIRYVANLNFTFLVNSAAHMYGYKPYDTRILPSENVWVSIVSLGEGWHNYHHVFPWDYRAAEMGSYSLNLTTFWLDQFAKIGWAYDMKKPSDKMIRSHAEKYAGHDHPVEVTEEDASTMDLEEINDNIEIVKNNNVKSKDKLIELINGQTFDPVTEKRKLINGDSLEFTKVNHFGPIQQKCSELIRDNNNFQSTKYKAA